MRKHTLRRLVALGAIGLSMMGAQAMAADYTTIVLSVDVARPANEVWKKVGGFCQIRDWMKLKCVYTSGTGDLGTVRHLADRIDEVMVGKTAHSYTYTQPDSKIMYHGTVDVEPAGPHASRIIYSLFYDQSNLTTDAAKAKAREQRTQVFTRALDSMKRLAESK
jgi:hypothetical protein